MNMTEFELAKLLETADLTGGTVIYDKTKVVVVAKSILIHPDFINESDFLFLIDKSSNIRVGGIMSLGDDIHIYIKPEYRGQGYTSHVMREVVPYWIPGLISITSTFPYQDAKIEYLATCAQLKLRSQHSTNNERYQMWRDMDKHKEEMLKRSVYARALANEIECVKALRECSDKVTHPRKLRKNYGISDVEFIEDLMCKNRIDCATGCINLPKLKYQSLNFHTATIEEIYQTMRRLCLVEATCEDEEHYIEFTPYNRLNLYDDEEDQPCQDITLRFIHIEQGAMRISLSNCYGRTYEWANKHELLLDENQQAHYKWGYIEIEDEYHINFVIHRDFQIEDICRLAEQENLYEQRDIDFLYE